MNGLVRARPGTKVAPQEAPYEPDIPLTAPGSPATQQLPAATRPATAPAPATAPVARNTEVRP